MLKLKGQNFYIQGRLMPPFWPGPVPTLQCPPVRRPQGSCGDVPGLFWHPKWVYLVALYSVLLNGAALLAQILPYGVFEQPP